ncbi:MAG: translocation/assembly module TamB domain-containing protein, partial [Acidobacteriota bacterium]|nr:translocation/assembly module TamB domain-containing protein [Acidobacteriota bacterium]
LEAPETDPDPLLVAVDLDLRVEGADGFLIDNNLADVEVDADYNIRGTAADPIILGRSTILAGRLFWGANAFDVVQGVVEFNNPFETEPVFEIRARTAIRRYTVDLTFSGSFQRGVSFSYSSTPPLSDLDLFNLLALGEEPDSEILRDSYGAAVGLQATRYLASQLFSEVERGAQRAFGLDRFLISPTLQGTETDATARFTVGKRINRNLYVTYSRLVSTSEDQLLTVEYQVSPDVRITGTREEDGSFGLDFLVQKRIR